MLLRALHDHLPTWLQISSRGEKLILRARRNDFLTTTFLSLQPNTCQCSQCRKQTGALVAHWITVAPSSVTWSSSQPKEYNSSPGCYRSFCADCGTAINWRTDKSPDMIQFLVGSLDEDVLSGMGGKELATPTKGQFFCKNMIGGVTDHIGDEVGKIWEGSPA